MNICFLYGKIISEIDFKFIINSKNVSVVRFDIILRNNSIIRVKAYNKLADYCYKNFKKYDKIYIYGKIVNNEIRIKEIQKNI